MKIDFDFPDDLVPSLFSYLGKGETPQTVEEATAIFLNYGLGIAGTQQKQNVQSAVQEKIARADKDELAAIQAAIDAIIVKAAAAEGVKI